MPPQELTSRRQWINWAMEGDRKIPKTIHGCNARTNDPSDFVSYSEACDASDKIAYVIQGDDEFTGVDVDNCLDDSGMLRAWAQPIVARLTAVSFGEVSPSGSGIKFITRAKKPEGAKCRKQFGGEKQQLECYDFNRFWTITGEIYAGCDTIGGGQEVINWVCDEHLSGESRGNLEGFSPTCFEPASSLPLEERAKRYVDSAEGSREGGRNDKAFRLAGHLLAMESDGRRLTAPDVTSLVMGWNLKCQPPLAAKEIESAVASAAKNGTPREAKPGILPEAVFDPLFPSVDQIPESLLRPPGIISDIMDYTLRTSLYPQPELALGAAIALVATITGRKLTDGYGTRTNLYVLGLAPSGSGKEHARMVNKQILAQSGGEHLIGPERIASSAGLVSSLVQQPARLFQLDEIGRLLATLKNPGKAAHLYNIATILMQLYASSNQIWIGDAYADVAKTPRISHPHAVVYGTSVPEGFWENLTAENVSDGLLGRILPIESLAGYVDPQTPESLSLPDDLIRSVKWWIEQSPGGNLGEAHPEPFHAEYTPQAAKRFEGHMMDIAKRRKDEEKDAAALWSRSAGKAGKLALIFAASRQPMTTDLEVSEDDVSLGIALSNHLTRMIQRRVFEHVSANEQEEKTNRVYRMLARPMTKSEITARTRWLKKRDRNEILETLIEAGLVECEVEETGGRTKTLFAQAGFLHTKKGTL